jgi:capsid protein
VFDPMRFTQMRGVTAFHPIFDKAGILEDIDFALLVKQQFAAMVAWFLKRDVNAQNPPDAQFGERQLISRGDGSTQTMEAVEPGAMYRGAPGEDLEIKSPNIPSHETMQHLRHTLQILSLNLGLPLCAALMDATETNFTGWRGAMDQAKLGFQVNQQRYEARFHRHVATFNVRTWMAGADEFARGLQRAQAAGRNVFSHWWQKPTWPYPQPLQDAQANAVKLQTGQIALRDFHAENGGDFGQFVEDSVADNERWIDACIVAAERLKTKHKDAARDVHWMHLYHRDFFKGGQLIDMLETPNDGSSTKAIKDGAGPAPSPGKK